MLHSRLKSIQTRAAQANNAALEADKERDELHTQIEEIEEHLQPKRARSDADDCHAHEIPAEVDDWDLRDHHREGTHVHNRRNVQVGSHDNQQKPRPGKDGFLLHTRLLLLHRVADDLSGLTFQEWDPSAGSDDTSAPVAMLVNSSELRAADFPLAEVRPLQLDTVARGGRRTRGAAGQNVSESSRFVCLWCSDAPEDQTICLFAELLANPDMPLSPRCTNGFPVEVTECQDISSLFHEK
jgi:hypothetical protein